MLTDLAKRNHDPKTQSNTMPIATAAEEQAFGVGSVHQQNFLRGKRFVRPLTRIVQSLRVDRRDRRQTEDDRDKSHIGNSYEGDRS